MKTLGQVLKTHADYGSLIRAVRRRLFEDGMIEDVVNHGIDGGFNGFIYYSDTCAFFDRHKQKIVDLIEELADECGVDADEFIQGFIQEFNCLQPDPPSKRVINKVLYGRGCNHEDVDTLKNALTWFVAETICYWFMGE